MNVTPISGTNSVPPVQNNNTSGQTTNDTTTRTSTNTQTFSQEAFLLDVINTFQNFGFNLIDSLGTNSSISSSSSTDLLNSDLLSGTNISLTEALNNFVFSLQSSLNQASSTNQTGTSGSTSTNDQNGFNNFSNDLLLLSLLNNGSINGNSSISSNPLLQSNFNTLVNILTPLSPGATTSPNLNDFFSMMLNNLQILLNNQNSVGTSVSTTV